MSTKYIGRIVQIIYQDAKGILTQRKIRVCRIADGKVMAYDLGRQAMRPFRLDRILAVQPLGRIA